MTGLDVGRAFRGDPLFLTKFTKLQSLALKVIQNLNFRLSESFEFEKIASKWLEMV